MKKSRLMLAAIILLAAMLLSACEYHMKATEINETPGPATLALIGKSESYYLGDDVIPSVTAAAGVRVVTSLETVVDDGIPYKQYSYESDTVVEDMIAYFQCLADDGYAVTQSYDLSEMPGGARFAKESPQFPGQLILIAVNYTEAGYAVKVARERGTLQNFSATAEK